MEYAHEFIRPDGEQRVFVERRVDGFWTLGEESRFWEEPHPAIGEGFFYWAPTEKGVSLFETEEIALSEAAMRFAWVCDQLRKD